MIVPLISDPDISMELDKFGKKKSCLITMYDIGAVNGLESPVRAGSPSCGSLIQTMYFFDHVQDFASRRPAFTESLEQFSAACTDLGDFVVVFLNAYFCDFFIERI